MQPARRVEIQRAAHVIPEHAQVLIRCRGERRVIVGRPLRQALHFRRQVAREVLVTGVLGAVAARQQRGKGGNGDQCGESFHV